MRRRMRGEAELRRRLRAGLRRVAAEIAGEARRRARVDVGALRQSIGWGDGPGLSVLVGYSLQHAPHARYLELGFRPHWVPARYIGRWMQRHGVGVQYVAGGRRYKTVRAVALGLYVGGPGSTLKYGGAGAQGRLFGPGGRLTTMTWATRGGRSRWLPPGLVGDPVLRETIERMPRGRLTAAFARGWQHGR